MHVHGHLLRNGVKDRKRRCNERRERGAVWTTVSVVEGNMGKWCLSCLSVCILSDSLQSLRQQAGPAGWLFGSIQSLISQPIFFLSLYPPPPALICFQPSLISLVLLLQPPPLLSAFCKIFFFPTHCSQLITNYFNHHLDCLCTESVSCFMFSNTLIAQWSFMTSLSTCKWAYINKKKLLVEFPNVS